MIYEQDIENKKEIKQILNKIKTRTKLNTNYGFYGLWNETLLEY